MSAVERITDVARAGIGFVDIAAPRPIVGAELGHGPDESEIAIIRLLGIRQLAQTALSQFPTLRTAGTAVDALHGISMLALAWRGPAAYRKGALTQAAIAGVFTAAGLISLIRRAR
jgi:hypothetical protein